ncbi:MAG: tRNA uridine-5-carboxymethylaminomethyl(34) synthesis GTPase MnmE [Planctomycetota bacterium]|jgi:tRNA modification GTPase
MTKQSFYLSFVCYRMLNVDDTIAAVSTATVPAGTVGRSVIRMSGPGTFAILSEILTPSAPIQKNRISSCVVHVDDELDIPGNLYAFFHPHSYTGEDLAELHLDACSAVVEAVLEKLYQHVRPAAPGEFTQRAFLNGKMDLTQAEAVAEIVSAANTTQLNAAEQLLKGRFSETIAALRHQILELLGLLEAGLDFSEEDIEFITPEQALGKIKSFKEIVSDVINDSVRCERLIDLDSVGLAGLPNAGKSRLLNALLGQSRSIVSDTEATTRDVLTGILQLEHLDGVLFDCAGLLNEQQQNTLINRLSHEASITALNKAAVVLFCVDADKQDTTADVQMRQQITAESIIYVMTKTDAVGAGELSQRRLELQEIFGAEFILTSSVTGAGLDELKKVIRESLLQLRRGDREHQDRLTINQRHERKLSEAIKLLNESAEEIKADSVEIAAMLLRQAHEQLGTLETEDISETILDSIFSRFCIGK